MILQEQLKYLEAHKTPFYLYDLELLNKTLSICSKAAERYGFHVHYALKANTEERILQLIQSYGFGADCVSGGEVLQAAENGFDPNKIVFAGVGKTDDEINLALEKNIFCFNVESMQELTVINQLAKQAGVQARVALRINPNVNAHTHQYITTGLEENKFGINRWEFDSVIELLKTLKHVQCIGLHFHIGSQITDLTAFKNLCIRANEIVAWFSERQLNIKVINVGGGLGVDYHHPDEKSIADFEAYFRIFDQFLERTPQQEVHFELGRSIIANCGTLISRVLYVKNGKTTNFTILDAGMTDLMRPALYQAYHKIENLSGHNRTDKALYNVVGPICESSDCFGKSVELPETQRGDIIAIRTAGAYGAVMSSSYNLRKKAEAIYYPK